MALIWKNVVRSFRQQSDSKDTIIASLQQTIDEDRRQLEALEHDMRIKDETIFVLRKAEADCRMLQEQLVAFKTTEYADSRCLFARHSSVITFTDLIPSSSAPDL